MLHKPRYWWRTFHMLLHITPSLPPAFLHSYQNTKRNKTKIKAPILFQKLYHTLHPSKNTLKSISVT